jgi:hypothetical protein
MMPSHVATILALFSIWVEKTPSKQCAHSSPIKIVFEQTSRERMQVSTSD